MNPLPRSALVAPRPRRLLVFADLDAVAQQRLQEAGATLTRANTVLGTVALLADRDFDAAILDLELSAELVRRLKSGTGQIEEVPDELAEKAARRQQSMPFFLVVDEGDQFAVVVDPPGHSYLENGAGLTLADAVLTLDVSKLVAPGAALA